MNGTADQTRDYVYAVDIVRTKILALEKSAPFGAYSAGSGIETALTNSASCSWRSPARIFRPGMVWSNRASGCVAP